MAVFREKTVRFYEAASPIKGEVSIDKAASAYVASRVLDSRVLDSVVKL